VFVGGAPCDAIEAVCATGLAELARLTEGSLGRVEENRFLMLESIHSFASGRLQLAGDVEAVRDRHARYFLEVARVADARLLVQDSDALDVFRNDHDNLRAALAFFAETDRHALLDLAASCGWFWFIRGHVTEGRRWLDAALDGADDAPVQMHAKALMRKGVIAEMQGDLDGAEQALSKALALRRAINDVEGAAAALSNLGNIALRRDDCAGAKLAYSEALGVARETDDAEGCASALCNLALVAEIEKDYVVAESLLEESLALAKEVGNRYGQTIVEQLIGSVARGRGNFDRARAFFGSSLEIACELDSPDLIVVSLEELALLASDRGDCAAGAYILGASTALRDRHGLHARNPGDKRTLAIDTIRNALDEVTYASEFSAGAETSTDEAIAYAFSRILDDVAQVGAGSVRN
jgi:tetratricopeptide (TPR) repeat protein